jgi:hypothetical protein
MDEYWQYLLNNWGEPAQAPVSGAFSPQNIEMILLAHMSRALRFFLFSVNSVSQW